MWDTYLILADLKIICFHYESRKVRPFWTALTLFCHDSSNVMPSNIWFPNLALDRGRRVRSWCHPLGQCRGPPYPRRPKRLQSCAVFWRYGSKLEKSMLVKIKMVQDGQNRVLDSTVSFARLISEWNCSVSLRSGCVATRNDQNLLTQPHLGMGHSLGTAEVWFVTTKKTFKKNCQNMWIQGPEILTMMIHDAPRSPDSFPCTQWCCRYKPGLWWLARNIQTCVPLKPSMPLRHCYKARQKSADRWVCMAPVGSNPGKSLVSNPVEILCEWEDLVSLVLFLGVIHGNPFIDVPCFCTQL